MSVSKDPPPGGGHGQGPGQLTGPHLKGQVRPGQTFAGAAMAASGSVPGGRSWQQIFLDAKQKRNILEIHIEKNDISEVLDAAEGENVQNRQKQLTNDQLSDFIFKELKIKERDCIGLDYFYGHKEVELREGVDLSPYLHVDVPVKYQGHSIFVKKQETNFATKILFRNVPLNVPDEELINLSLCYGQPIGGVKREKLTNVKDKGRVGSNRTLDVILNPGAAFENFFWMEGPLPSDQGRRITVTHQNQPQQCSNCFGFSKIKYGGELGLCPGNGNGRACKALGTERTKMGPYMRELERLLGYRSIKAKFSHMGNMEELNMDEEEADITFNATYKSPIVEKDEEIKTLIREKDALVQEKLNMSKDIPKLKENLTKAESKLGALEKAVKIKAKQLNQASSFTERRLAEMISFNPANLEGNPDLVPLLAILQERDNFNVDSENEVIKPIHEEDFLLETLKNVEDISSQDPNIRIDQCKERLGSIKNQLLESVKQRWIKPGRRNSLGSSVLSGGSNKRDREDRSLDRISRQRITSPNHN